MNMNHQNDRRFLQNQDPFIAQDLEQMRLAKNYNNWLYQLVKPYLGKRVLEIGAGIGTVSTKIITEVDLLISVEPNPYCVRQLKSQLGSNPKFILFDRRLEDCSAASFNDYKVDTVLCINVLEHIEDDLATLRLFEEVIQSGGRVVLLLPAVPQAYGPIDQAVGHFRRYSKSSIQSVLNQTTLIAERYTYSNFVGLLGWFFNARIKKSIRQSSTQIKLFDWLTPLISTIERTFGCPIGLSLISISRKAK